MKFQKTLQLAAGYLFLMTGVLWIGQGTGLLHFAGRSQMIGQMSWAYRGMGLAAVGIILLWAASKIKQK